MSKANNLTDFLTGVANAIRAKKGTTGTINPQNFESEIASISGGGGIEPQNYSGNLIINGDVGDGTYVMFFGITEEGSITFSNGYYGMWAQKEYYSPGSSGLAFNDSCLAVVFCPDYAYSGVPMTENPYELTELTSNTDNVKVFAINGSDPSFGIDDD